MSRDFTLPTPAFSNEYEGSLFVHTHFTRHSYMFYSDLSVLGKFAEAVSKIIQGIDGSARKPALVQDTQYMIEKTYHL